MKKYSSSSFDEKKNALKEYKQVKKLAHGFN